MECYKNYQTDGPGTHGLFTSVYSMQLFHQRKNNCFCPSERSRNDCGGGGGEREMKQLDLQGPDIKYSLTRAPSYFEMVDKLIIHVKWIN